MGCVNFDRVKIDMGFFNLTESKLILVSFDTVEMGTWWIKFDTVAIVIDSDIVMDNTGWV